MKSQVFFFSLFSFLFSCPWLSIKSYLKLHSTGKTVETLNVSVLVRDSGGRSERWISDKHDILSSETILYAIVDVIDSWTCLTNQQKLGSLERSWRLELWNQHGIDMVSSFGGLWGRICFLTLSQLLVVCWKILHPLACNASL